MKRHSKTDRPLFGTEVLVSPIKQLTVHLIASDTEHKYYNKNVTGIVMEDIVYIIKMSKIKGLKLRNLVPIRTCKNGIHLVHPDFLISGFRKNKDEERSNNAKKLTLIIEDRIKELNNIRQKKGNN